MIAIQRGCGFPIAGGVYLKTDLNDYGTPWKYFVFDPTVPIYNPGDIGIAAQGVTLIEENGVTNVIDWIGASHYPFVPCFIEEGIRLGFSRRVPKNTDFGKITSQSRHVLIHKNGSIVNAKDYYANRVKKECFSGNFDHQEGNTDWTCINLLWEAMDHGKSKTREITYKMPSFSFTGWTSPDGVKPDFQLAAFMWLPISRIEVVADNLDGTHESALALLKKSGTEIPYEVADYGEEVVYDRPDSREDSSPVVASSH